MAPMASVLREQANRLLRKAEVEDETVAEAKERSAATNARKRELDGTLEKLAGNEKDPVRRAHRMAEARRDWRAGELEAEEQHIRSVEKAIADRDADWQRRTQKALAAGTSKIDQQAEQAAAQLSGIAPRALTTWLGTEEGRLWNDRGKVLREELATAERRAYLARQRLAHAKRLASRALSADAISGLQTLANVVVGVDELVALTGHGVDFRSPQGVLSTLRQFGIEPEA